MANFCIYLNSVAVKCLSVYLRNKSYTQAIAIVVLWSSYKDRVSYVILVAKWQNFFNAEVQAEVKYIW